jgi:hypothetical protein
VSAAYLHVHMLIGACSHTEKGGAQWSHTVKSLPPKCRRESPSAPILCLDPQYRRELARVYLSNVEGICRRFVEGRRDQLQVGQHGQPQLAETTRKLLKLPDCMGTRCGMSLTIKSGHGTGACGAAAGAPGLLGRALCGRAGSPHHTAQ